MKNFFDNTEIAFKLKSDAELDRAYFLFKMIAHQPLVKMGTAITNFAIKAHLPVEGIIRATVFDHFCGGVSELDCMKTVDALYTAGVCSVLDYSVEGKETEEQFDAVVARTLKLIDFVNEKEAIPFAVFKPTAMGRFDLYVKVGEGKKLNPDETKEWDRVKNRFNTVCEKAYELGVSLLIDAEESWMQKAADEIVEEMMVRYNTEKAVVFNTLQMYRWDRMEYLKELHARAKEKGFIIGMKLVRGAYMEKENDRAEEMGYPTPICASKKETDDNFNTGVRYMMEHLDVMELFLGTHNEDSTLLVLSLMEEKGISKDDHRIWFGQLYGMSDHISYNLAHKDYHVAKYLPFGPVRDVMPYLIRRAEENTSVAGQTTRELTLLSAERKRRKM
ncbi:proline dehydrogenase family protein [Galbibacter sp. BG1]|uniref:proline dehydrogenase family protein n=1 Tax=Galbibacter sp. BG1 TaxID=1170699 RepID=UPI0015BE4024|nr:proline dehydrogenase family protein [Galbibacter sp. BG1]QLE02810.1 proline dehydrogenase family protein [Galbibacter sp. BG1]